MSEWVSEAQRIAREAAEVTAKELLCRANHAMGWLVEGCPSAAQLVLESMVLRRPPPDAVLLAQAAERDRKRNEAKASEVALNERIADSRDAALEEAAHAAFDGTCGTCHLPIHWVEDAGEYRQGEWEHDTPSSCLGKPSGSPLAADHIRALKGRK